MIGVLDQYLDSRSGRGYVPPGAAGLFAKPQHNVVMPEWMISCDDLLSSTIEGFDTYGVIDDWRTQEVCHTTGSPAGQLLSTAASQHSNIYVLVENGIYIPALETKMHTKANIALVEIVRLGKVGAEIIPLEEIKYTNCKVEAITTVGGDRTIIEFRPETKEHIYHKYKQDGTKEGQTVSKMNFTTGVAE